MKIRYLIALLGFTLLVSSCNQKYTELPYFTNIDQVEISEANSYDIKIEPGDELFIQVSSTVPSASAPYNLPVATPSKAGMDKSIEQGKVLTYTVDGEGYIQFPVLGKIKVAGLTLDQLSDKLSKLISADVSDPTITVEMMNFVVNVGGEVLKPGRINIKSRRFSILDALAQVGDLTPYGKRESVLIIREENGKRTHARLNLNDANVLNSPYFFLKQNDYIYVEPNKIKEDNAKVSSNTSQRLQITSIILTTVSLIASTCIAIFK